MVKGKIEVKTSENRKSQELNFAVSSGKGTGRNTPKHQEKAAIKTEEAIAQTDEYHFAVKQQDERIDECKIRRPVFVFRGKEKEKILKELKKKKGWTKSLSILDVRSPDYYICFDLCKLAEAYSFDVETTRELILDSRFVSKPTEIYVAEATGGKATLNDQQPDVIVKN